MTDAERDRALLLAEVQRLRAELKAAQRLIIDAYGKTAGYLHWATYLNRKEKEISPQVYQNASGNLLRSIDALIDKDCKSTESLYKALNGYAGHT